MTRLLAWFFLLTVAGVTVLFQPIVHTVKPLITGEEHYNAWTTRAAVMAALRPTDIVMVQPDHLMAPFNDMVYAHYASGGHGRIFFPFQHNVPNVDRERLVTERLTCYVDAFNATGIVFGLHEGWLEGDAQPNEQVVLSFTTGISRVRADVTVADTIYSFKDGVFFRGHVDRMVFVQDDVATDPGRLLYDRDDGFSACVTGLPDVEAILGPGTGQGDRHG